MLDDISKYLTIFKFAPIGISIVDSERNIIEANKILEKIAGLSGDNLRKGEYKIRKYIHSDGRDMSADELPSTIALREKRSVCGVEVGIKLEDGKIIWTEVSAAPLGNEGKYAVVMIQDITARKNVELQLKVSEEKFRLFFENSLDAVLLTDISGKIYSANSAACIMFGMTEKELCEAGREGVTDKEDPRLELALNQRELTGTFIGELTLLRKDGTKFQAELSSSVFTDSAGLKLTSMIIRDITERKRIEASLKSSEEKWRQLVKTIPDYIALHDLEGRYIFLNHYAEGFTERDVVGRNLFDFLSDDSKDEFRKHFNACIKTKQPQQFNYSAYGDNKTVRYYDGHLVPITDNGNLIHILSVALDITSRKRADDERKNALEWQEAIFEGSNDAIFISDQDSFFVAVNSAACELTAYSKEELLKMRIPDIHDENDLIAFNKYFHRILEGEKIMSEAKILRKDGIKTDTEFNNRVITISGKLYMHTTARNISRRKKIEQELRNSYKRLEHLNKHLHNVWENEKSQIAMNLHDDLGQRLTAINLDLAWIKKRIPVQSGPVTKKFKDLSLAINETIESIAETSGLLSSRMLLELGLFDSIKLQLRKFEKQSGIRCKFISATPESGIDEFQSLVFYRILQECLTNIARHSKATSARVTLDSSNNEINFSIKDNGVGIDEGKIISSKSMGFAGIRERAKLVNGLVLITCDKGKGTLVRVSIPSNK